MHILKQYEENRKRDAETFKKMAQKEVTGRVRKMENVPEGRRK